MKKEYKVTVKKRIDGTKIERWFFKDNLHREDGLAYIEYNKDGSIWYKEYYIEGNKVLPFESRQEFLKRSKSCAGKIVEIDGKKYKLEEVE